MNTTTAKPTPGPILVTGVGGNFVYQVDTFTNLNIWSAVFSPNNGCSSNYAADAAALLVEADGVRRELGLTPRQLADQRAELIVALEKICDLVDSRADYTAQLRLADARAALARAKAVPK